MSAPLNKYLSFSEIYLLDKRIDEKNQEKSPKILVP